MILQSKPASFAKFNAVAAIFLDLLKVKDRSYWPSRLLSVALTWALAGASAWAQAGARPDFRFDKLEFESPNANVSVRDILQDSAGMLWFACGPDGVRRYDGYRFDAYSVRAGQATQGAKLPGWLVQDLLLDRTGQVWVGLNEGVARFDPDKERFQPFRFSEENPSREGVQGVRIGGLAQTADHTVWAVVEYGGLYSLALGDSLLRKSPLNFGELQSIRSHPEDPQALLCGGRGRILTVRNDSIVAQIELSALDEPAAEPAYISAMAVGGRSALWVGTDDGRVLAVNWRNGAVLKELEIENQIEGGQMKAGIARLMIDNVGRVWAMTNGSGIFLYDPATGVASCFRRRVFDPTSVADDRCHAVHQDRSGTVWIGTPQGVQYYDAQQQKFGFYRHMPGADLSLSHKQGIRSLQDARRHGARRHDGRPSERDRPAERPFASLPGQN